MKKHIFLAYALLLLFIFPLSAKKVMQLQTIAQKSALTEIVTQANKIIRAESPQSRVEEKKNLILLIKEKQFDTQTRGKIAYAIAIILRTSPQTMQLSKEAYSFLVALLQVQQAQENIINVAQQIKVAVATASEQEKKRVVDAALKQLQSVTQEAQMTIDGARTRINNMMQLSEMALEGKLDSLKAIVKKANEIIMAQDKQARSKAQKEFADLIKRLDKNMKDAIISDLEAIQQTTDETLPKSQEAYDRLLTMTHIVDQEITDMVSVVEKEREKIENADVSTFGKVRNFVANKMASLTSLLQRASSAVGDMMPLTYLQKQDLLLDRMSSLHFRICKDKNLMSAQLELKSLMQREDLDEDIKKAFYPFIEKLNKGEEIKYRGLTFTIRPEASFQLKLLESIYKSATAIIDSYTYSDIAWGKSDKVREHQKDYIITDMNGLYQKIKNTIEPDIRIILNTTNDATNDTIEQARQALNRLEKAVNEQRPLLNMNRARHAISSQGSKLMGLVPESVTSFVAKEPGIVGGVVLGILGIIVQRAVIDPYRNWAYNYGILKDESYYFNGILKSLDAAAQEKPNGEMEDANKYHVLMGVLEGLGLQFKEGWEKNKNKGRIRKKTSEDQ